LPDSGKFFVNVHLEAGAQPGGDVWGICPPPKISKHCIEFLTFAETFKE